MLLHFGEQKTSFSPYGCSELKQTLSFVHALPPSTLHGRVQKPLRYWPLPLDV